FFFGGAMLSRRPQIDDRLHALILKLLQVLETWLAAVAEVFVDAKKIPDRRRLLLRCEWQRQQNKKTDADSSVHGFVSDAVFNSLWLPGSRASRPLPSYRFTLVWGGLRLTPQSLWHSPKA